MIAISSVYQSREFEFFAELQREKKRSNEARIECILLAHALLTRKLELAQARLSADTVRAELAEMERALRIVADYYGG